MRFERNFRLKIKTKFHFVSFVRYKTPPRPILRHIILSDFKEKVPLAPFINQETEPIVMYDPLPPFDSINIYERPTMTTPSNSLPDASPFSMFFQSLLPNFNVVPDRRPNAVALAAANQAAAAAAAPNADRQNEGAGGGDGAAAGGNANVAEWDANVAEWDAHELRLYDEIDNGT